MTSTKSQRVAILYYGDLETRRATTRDNHKLPTVFKAFEELGVEAEPVVYNDDALPDVQRQLAGVGAVLVWVNPIEDARDRSKLDSLLRELAASGVYVSTHPDVILKLGTKEVLYRTRHLGWGTDTHLYSSLEDLRRELPDRLLRGEARVLKQYRGQSGEGVWRVERAEDAARPGENFKVRARHAQSGCFEEIMTLGDFFDRCAPYFTANSGQGRMIDQIYQPRLTEGMVRCYLVHGRVEGFGRQEIVALHPAPPGAPPETAPKPTKRHYHPSTMPEFQRLKRLVEEDWVPAARRLLEIEPLDLPALWDCDFMFGPKDENGNDTYVLCEINVSCVSPFPESAALPLARATNEKMRSTSR